MATPEQLWDLVVQQNQGVLATIGATGRPQLSNILYVVDKPARSVRISTTADRVKARNLARDARASLHVGGEDFWHFAVAEGTATLSAVATSPGDDAVRELAGVHSAFYGPAADQEAFAAEMIANRRLVVRLAVEHLYGVMASPKRRPTAPAD